MTEATAPATEALVDEATMQELIKLNEQRAATYGLLSRLYVDEGYRLLATYLSNTWDNSVTDLAIDYVRVFIGHGIDAFSAAYPFESVYTSEKRLLMQEARDEVLAIYRSAGLDKQDTWKEGGITLHSSWSSSRSWPRARSKRCAKATKTRPSRC